MTRIAALLALAACAWLATAPALAQSKTYVSRTGTDSNNCLSVTTACANFSRAIAQAGPRGEVMCLDSGIFGFISITFSIHIKCSPHVGQTGFSFNTVNTAAGDVVVLDGIDIDFGGATTNPAITFSGAGTLHLRNSTMRSAPTGLSFIPNGAATLFITNTMFDNNSNGIIVDGTRTSSLIQVSVRDSITSNNAGSGLLTNASSAEIRVMLDNVNLSHNGVGVNSNGARSNVIIGRSTVFGNQVGLGTAGGGKIYSYGNNLINGNNNDNVNASVLISQN
jgi:hypothetical protein